MDTSALMAVVLDEPDAEACSEVLATEDAILISAGTLAEALIVSRRREVGDLMAKLVNGLECQVASVTQADAVRVAEAYSRWGRGLHHPAGLNYGDCFAYALARQRDCPLLFVGDDFIRTDITPCIRRS
ncbi:type II toxin-antitoxin system VapC family toxin [Rhodovastum atsumiense]|uniref:type II toxin-antitoxin system VapC family toxin n=1 Tax=Rhodovastum atsumiense TaxID=504468 RepID=UPI0024E0A26E|nr:type II toxin-antitoxin system VapC family toxin [Rhodovastum atsumiense]